MPRSSLALHTLTGSLVLLASLPAIGAGEAQSTVAEVMIERTYGNFAFVRMSVAPTTPAGCSINGYWHFTLPLTADIDKRMFALLMTARATGKVVAVSGSGACNEFGPVESIQRLGF